MIDGVRIVELKQITDERGMVMHMLKSTDSGFSQFGEIYFSGVRVGAIKAWHIHDRMTLNYAVPHGLIKFVLHDDRVGSPTNGETQEIYLGTDNYHLVTVPPLVWNGFKGIADGLSIVANCASIPHDPAEIRRRDPFDRGIGYNWDLKHG